MSRGAPARVVVRAFAGLLCAAGVALAGLVALPVGSAQAVPGDAVELVLYPGGTVSRIRFTVAAGMTIRYPLLSADIDTTLPPAPASGGIGDCSTPALGASETYVAGAVIDIALSDTSGACSELPSKWRSVRLISGWDNAIFGEAFLTVAPPPAPVAPGANCRLTPALLALVARGAGATADELPTMVAVALAESSGQLNAVNVNPSPLSYDLGLWQINDVAHGFTAAADQLALLSDAGRNAREALVIKRAAGGWSPWVAYKTGAHLKHLAVATAAVADTAGSALGGTAVIGCAQVALNPDGSPVVEPGPDSSVGAGCSGWSPITYLRCAFIPSAGSTSRFTALGGNLASVVPFNYVTDALATFDKATRYCDPDKFDTLAPAEGRICESGLSVSLPAIAGTGDQSTTINILGAESSAVQAMQPLRPFFSVALYLAFFGPLAVSIWGRLFPVVNG